jgi:predicted CoA-substrate-specific enzyme activase
MKTHLLGIDIGSTTAKLVMTDNGREILFTSYERHNIRTVETLIRMMKQLLEQFGDIAVRPTFTGSAGMGIAEQLHQPFVQEVIAASIASNTLYPGIRSMLDIGGEDAKLVLFSDNKSPDMRMNGNCAGGTGAYIDQMASLLNISIQELNELAGHSSKIYPIASRCGVFAKTDVQNLISRKINPRDIAASIFDAVAGQVINALARGCTIEPRLLFCGGPLTYISNLRAAFCRLLKLQEEDIVVPTHAELFTAVGAALAVKKHQKSISISNIIKGLEGFKRNTSTSDTLTPLFNTTSEIKDWENNRKIIPIPEAEVSADMPCFAGIDSGSTTTKICIMDQEGRLVYQFYRNNNGHALETAVEGLRLFSEDLKKKGIRIDIRGTAVTGYGEELIRSALGLDYGIVETVAHFLAARHIEPGLTFILDIGGQDIKAISVRNNTITNIEINEACSSGCGSFIEGFARTLGYTPSEFSEIALAAEAPYDLGSRCTVFMNSKVKQALRDGATVADLAAGLSYSVIKNCLTKVLKIKNYSEIGDHIVVQGGAFRNKAVYRSLELLSERSIVCSDKPELMGAFGAALYARRKFMKGDLTEHGFIGMDALEQVKEYQTKMSSCHGCTNKCRITTYQFANGKKCFSGNKCEKIFSNHPAAIRKEANIIDYKRNILFEHHRTSPSVKRTRIGIPRILNMYENFPFWNTMFTHCGFEVVLSDESSDALYKKGNGAVMSDNICFPAKLSHGHIHDLIEKNVDHIFFPFVVFEKKDFSKSSNSFNCPIVTGYSEVLKSTSDLLLSRHIPFHSPSINFNDPVLLEKACIRFLRTLGIKKSMAQEAVSKALIKRTTVKEAILAKNRDILDKAIKENTPLVMLAAHPYHIDQLIHQQVSQMLSDLGVAVINEELAVDTDQEGFEKFFSIAQWEYPNRVLQAAWWVSRHSNNIGFLQLNSFGCGPDSFIIDEIADLAKQSDLPYGLIRIDEISSPGSTRLRLRSLVESMRLRTENRVLPEEPASAREKNAIFEVHDANKTILVPWFSDFYSPYIPVLARIAGYELENLPPSDQRSIDFGLDYANNEICYPATLVVGDIIRGLKSGKHKLENVAVGITQTGGQCRATNYIALIKRAMVNSGFADIPVISVATTDGLHNLQPGFNPDWQKLIKPALKSLLFADSLSRMYYATVCREIVPGSSATVRDHFIQLSLSLIEAGTHNALLPLLKKAVKAFNSIAVREEEVQTVGIVGEIYIKYNSFGQFDIINWLIDHHIEVAQPPLLHFFMQTFVNMKVSDDEHIQESSSSRFLINFLKWRAGYYISRFEKALRDFRYYRPVHGIEDEARLASDILSLANQYGEGWLIPAEIASFSRQNINRVVCMQPFGCVANHIIGKGMEKKIKKLYPDMNLLFLDFDYGTSRVNVINRLHFLIQNQEDLVNLEIAD